LKNVHLDTTFAQHQRTAYWLLYGEEVRNPKISDRVGDRTGGPDSTSSILRVQLLCRQAGVVGSLQMQRMCR